MYKNYKTSILYEIITSKLLTNHRQDLRRERASPPHAHPLQDQGGAERDRGGGEDPAGAAGGDVRGHGEAGEDGVHPGADALVPVEQGLHQGADHQQEDQREVLRVRRGRR